MFISSVLQMRNMDQAAIDQYGIPAELLMENAGLAVTSVIQSEFGISQKKFLVICGHGNNGGDGFVVARKLFSEGADIKVCLLGETKKFSHPTSINFKITENLPFAKSEIHNANEILEDIKECDAIVDAIFGTGLTRNVEGLYKEVIDLVNSSEKTIFSIDIPSGVHGDTGQILNTAINANYTITFGTPKIGNILYPGYSCNGKLFVSKISFPPDLFNHQNFNIAINQPIPLPKRSPQGHKGDFGEAIFIAGSESYFGAPYFSALSFLKAGGGYSRLAAPRSIIPTIAAKSNEIVFLPMDETKNGSIALSNKDDLLAVISKMDFVVLGPGLSLDAQTQCLVTELIREIKKPLLLDGDGITAVCSNPEQLKKRIFPTILTPHLGEMSRLTALSIHEIQKDPLLIVQQTSMRLNSIIVLKGAHSLIGFPDGKVFINTSGNSGMATAGSGDVLTGTIAAMNGLGLPINDAVRMGVFIHGLSGDLASQEKGEDGITAQDILDFLPLAVKLHRAGLPKELSVKYQIIHTV